MSSTSKMSEHLMEKVLVVAAHPDDEVLGCAGTIAYHAAKGDLVRILFLADGVSSRADADRENIRVRKNAAIKASKILGVSEPIFLGLSDNRLDTHALLDVVKKIEALIEDIRPTVVYTHHHGDLNIDHQITNRAVLTACRPQPGASVHSIHAFEVLSSTEWNAVGHHNAFQPNLYIEIDRWLQKKIDAAIAYELEIREFPHSRSIEMIKHLAHYRGGCVGIGSAEAFETIREIRKII